MRVLDNNQNSIVFPADGRHTVITNLSNNQRIYAKGQKLNLADLFQSKELAKTFEGGSAVISRLCQ